jgi:hypothetical protein
MVVLSINNIQFNIFGLSHPGIYANAVTYSRVRLPQSCKVSPLSALSTDFLSHPYLLHFTNRFLLRGSLETNVKNTDQRKTKPSPTPSLVLEQTIPIANP